MMAVMKAVMKGVMKGVKKAVKKATLFQAIPQLTLPMDLRQPGLMQRILAATLKP